MAADLAVVILVHVLGHASREFREVALDVSQHLQKGIVYRCGP